MKDASVCDPLLRCVRLPLDIWWKSVRPDGAFGSMDEVPVGPALLSPGLPGATQLFRLMCAPIRSGERKFWLRESGDLARSLSLLVA